MSTAHLRQRDESALEVTGENANIGLCLARVAQRSPQLAAVHAPHAGRDARAGWHTILYAELDQRCDAIAHGLARNGLQPGQRVAVFVRPGVELVAITFALFKLGAVPVLLDPGMGRKALVACLAKMQPRAFIGVPRAQLLRVLHAHALASIELAVTVGAQWFPGAMTLDRLVQPSAGTFACAHARGDDEAAILFTSGSTGPPKGVVYTHAMFQAQIRALRELYAFAPGGVDLACFPLFALFNTALEATSVFPRIDFAHPGRCDPAAIVDALLTHGATNTFGSPSIWRRVAPFCSERGVRLTQLERVLIAGAPVSPALVQSMQAVLSERCDVHTPYGATECLPVCSISGRELVGPLRALSDSGAGNCVGRAAPGIELALIAIGEDPIAHWRPDLALARGAVGEICATGDVVTREYKFEPQLTAAAKIQDGARVWHRTGDLGWFDDEGRLWFCGRKAHRLETQHGMIAPVPTENIYNRHPSVRRSALVGVGLPGSERPTLVIEAQDGAHPRSKRARERFRRELAELRRASAPSTRPPRLAQVETILFKPAFPLDVRHNAKIQREQLKLWAQRRTR